MTFCFARVSVLPFFYKKSKKTVSQRFFAREKVYEEMQDNPLSLKAELSLCLHLIIPKLQRLSNAVKLKI